MKSIIQNKKECFLCKTNYDVVTTTELNEKLIFNKYPINKQSEKYGLKIYLCPRHNNFDKYQEKFKKALELSLKQLAQTKFEETHKRIEFIKYFNKSYL